MNPPIDTLGKEVICYKCKGINFLIHQDTKDQRIERSRGVEFIRVYKYVCKDCDDQFFTQTPLKRKL